MLDFLRHQVKEHLDKIIDNTILNCHAEDLHSVMFVNTPEQRIRMFYTGEEHSMWRNKLYLRQKFIYPMSVGIHSHHCNLTILPFKGHVYNVTFELSDSGKFEMNKYEHVSGVSNDLTFREKGKAYLKFKNEKLIISPIYMKAEELHTVYVPKEESVAWIILEGKEDPNYKSFTYSNMELDKEDFSNLYKKPSREQALKILSLIGLL